MHIDLPGAARYWFQALQWGAVKLLHEPAAQQAGLAIGHDVGTLGTATSRCVAFAKHSQILLLPAEQSVGMCAAAAKHVSQPVITVHLVLA